MIIPTLETARLLLRAHTKADFNSLKLMWADPTVVKHISGIPSTEGQSWMRMMTYLGHWELMGFGYWAIIEKDTDQYVGDIGLADFKREISTSIAGAPEAGWVLAAQAHGKGYAREALTAVLQWSDTILKPSKTVCLINEENTRSISLALKCGYVEMARTTFMDKPTIMYSRKS